MNKIFDDFFNNITYSYISSYYNIDITPSLSLNSLEYTINDIKNSTYTINNSLLFNIVDNSIYNIFKINEDKYSYQANNLLFINNENNIYQLSYNLLNTNKFIIKDNYIKLNLDNKSLLSNNNIITSNINILPKLRYNNKGLYKVNNNIFYIDDNTKSLSINNTIDSFPNDDYNLLVNKNEYITNKLSKTTKYKDIQYTNNINHNNINNIINKNISFNYIDRNQYLTIISYYSGSSSQLKFNNEIVITNTNFAIFEIPIYYTYRTNIYKKFKIHKELPDFTINDIIISINFSLINLNKYISINKSKTYIYNNKIDSIKYIKSDNTYIGVVTNKVMLSLYIDINEYIYDSLSDLMVDNSLQIDIKYKDKNKYNNYNYIYKLGNNSISDKDNVGKIFLKKSNNFIKLYHDYNYGFNYNKHGKCIGLLLLKKYKKNTINNFYLTPAIIYNEHMNLENSSSKSVKSINIIKYNKKDIYVNFDDNSINNILIDNNIIYKNDITTISNMKYFNYLNVIKIKKENENNEETYITPILESINIENIINDPEYNSYNIYTLNKSNINIIDNYRQSFTTSKNYITAKSDDYNIKQFINLSVAYNTILPTIIYDLNDSEYFISYLSTKNINIDDNIVANNIYINENKQINKIFDNIYNYRKSGLLKGDFYTPSIYEYLILYYFNIFDYFNKDIYNKYIKNEYEFITNQFYKSTNDLIYNYYISNNKLNLQGINIEDYPKELYDIKNSNNANIEYILDKYYVQIPENCNFIDLKYSFETNKGKNTVKKTLKWKKQTQLNYASFRRYDSILIQSPQSNSSLVLLFYYAIFYNNLLYVNKYELSFFTGINIELLTTEYIKSNIIDNKYTISRRFTINEYPNLIITHQNKYANLIVLNNEYYENNNQIKNLQQTNINLFADESKKEIDSTFPKHIWPFFKIPDISIINSKDYHIIYNENDNCEYLDYYVDSTSTSININYRNYHTSYNLTFNLQYKDFIANIVTSSNNLVDNDNDIYTIKIDVRNLSDKVNNILTIYYKDTEESLNNTIINDNYYRILCKVILKVK